jgi:hypothetical protein
MILESRPVDRRDQWRKRYEAAMSEQQRQEAFRRSARMVNLTAYRYAHDAMQDAQDVEPEYIDGAIAGAH